MTESEQHRQNNLSSLFKNLRPEDPRRLKAFRYKLKDLNWDSQHVEDSLSILFEAVDELAEAEVKYYYRRRGSRALVSGLCRFAGWLTGSVGLLLPLLAAAQISEVKGFAELGYVFLALSASFFGANSLFGGTEGHIRFVATQLQLEKLITDTRLEWCQYLSSAVNDDNQISTGFAIINAYANELYSITLAETGHWGENLRKELAKYQEQIKVKKNTKAN